MASELAQALPTSRGTLAHDAFFYAGDEEYVHGLRAFARDGLDAGEAMLVAVPGERLALLRPALDEYAEQIEFVDMSEQGKNPARILPFIQGFIDTHAGRPVRFVDEPIWAGRTAAEIVEGHRHEALINAAFADRHAHIVCPYDTRGLGADVIADARRTHPTVLAGGERRCCHAYADPLAVYAADDSPLGAPPVDPLTLSFAEGLSPFRRAVQTHATAAGLDGERLAGFVLAANEAAANTMCHAGGEGTARLWADDESVVCELSDRGRIDDPFVGRVAPPPLGSRGRGVWMMNQLCDLVELRSGTGGTVVRIHMRLH